MNEMTIRAGRIEGALPEKYVRAMELHSRAEANLHSAAVSLAEVGRCLKEMRDGQLYTELGFRSLEEYSEARLGIRRSQAYKMIQVSEHLPEDFVRSTGQIGIEKLALLALATPEEREAVQEHVDLGEVTVKELKAEIAALRKENAELTQAAEQVDTYARQFDDLTASRNLAEDRAGRLTEQVKRLTAQVTELESRPVEHAVQEVPDPEQQKKIDELTARLRQNEADYTQRIQTAQREHADRLREVQQELARAQAAVKPETVPDTRGIFKAYLANAADALNRLMAFVESARDDESLPLYLSKVDDMIRLTAERRQAYDPR
ncbi:MAG: hypothetical protein IJ236_06805 [Oscillospiraceae bacterium]|nr:hypothetical protein [Oscillospiraceae bacterium]